MATINKQGNVIANCPGCDGAKSTFEYMVNGNSLSCVTKSYSGGMFQHDDHKVRFQMFRCAGCGRGALGAIKMMNVHGSYPADIWELLDFYPESRERLKLPASTPRGIVAEFREAELCMEAGCFRASAALFRSVLDKTLRANGYKTERNKNLRDQIDEASADGVITAARKRRAHEELRVLGNDVLHDEWKEVKLEEVEPAHQYAQRILEDFYDDRATVLESLKVAGRTPVEDKKAKG
jgi:hypothetical protein